MPRELRAIVFYAEDVASWKYLEPVVRQLSSAGRKICYLTSAKDDPILSAPAPNVTAFYIGDGVARTFLFMVLQADVMVMTMPDLETFHIKRSRLHPVHYAYIFHSMASTHMVYRFGAYDHFDTILCTGPHHVLEIRRQEQLCGLPAKNLVEHGYALLDRMMEEDAQRARRPDVRTRILIAPSWDQRGLLGACGPALVSALLEAGFVVSLRPHPISFRKSARVIEELRQSFGTRPDFTLEESVAAQDSLYASDLMITDWSGAGMDYAFALERPVLFIDVPRKVNNPRYLELNLEPLEVSYRLEVGAILSPGEATRAPEEIRRLLADPQAFRRKLSALRERFVYNPGRSGEAGAAALARLADEVAERMADF